MWRDRPSPVRVVAVSLTTLVVGFVLVVELAAERVSGSAPVGLGAPGVRGIKYAFTVTPFQNNGLVPIELTSARVLPGEIFDGGLDGAVLDDIRVTPVFPEHSTISTRFERWATEDRNITNTEPIEGTVIPPGDVVHIFFILEIREPGCYQWGRWSVDYRTVLPIPGKHLATGEVEIRLWPADAKAADCFPGSWWREAAGSHEQCRCQV